MKPLYIGIDTGRETGLAVWDPERRAFVSVITTKIHRALRLVDALNAANAARGVVVVFEDARLRKWIPKERSMRERVGRAIGAGHVERDATVWQDFLDDAGIRYVMQPPAKGLTKWSPEQFAAVTGWKGRTSNHARDAALLVFGR